MAITLTIERSPSAGEPVGTARTFEGPSATLGRGQRNDWVLRDEGAFLSRNHCEIVCENGVYAVIDTSQSGLFVNGASTPLGKGNRAVLRHGDSLSLGEYDLRVSVSGEQQAAIIPQFGIPQAGIPQASPPTPFGGELPFGRIPDFPFGDSPFAAREPSPSLTYHDPALPMRDDAGPERLAIGGMGGSIIPDDWDRDLLRGPNQAPSSSPSPFSSSASLPPAAPASPAADVAFAAFVGGAGLKGRVLADVDPVARLKEAGKTYRAAVDGILEILKAREQFKEALRIDRTQLNSSGNNPLKFCPDTEQALLTMIGGNRPGYMLAREAVREALKDIKAHEMALVAAMQVALKQLLAQIDPEALKRRLGKSWLDGLAPAVRKARMWEIYEAEHAQLARDLADDFDRAFGSAFAEAYEEYIRAK